MRALELQTFDDVHVEDAARLLAERQRRHREAEPLLPDRFEDRAAARAELEALWRADGASGAVALRGRRAVGYLLGVRKDDEVWGPNVWIDPAGHAVEQAEDARDLYGAASARWVDEGRTRQYAVVPASDADLVDAWFRLSFGQQQAFGISAVSRGGWPDGVRPAEPRDVEALIELAPLLSAHQALAPVFGARRLGLSDGELRRELEEDLERPDVGSLVAEHEGRIVGNFVVCRAEQSAMHAGLARPDEAAYLAFAATLPAARGSGAGVALTAGVFAWAHERGFRTMVTDWRVTNLLASRFWPRRGFATSFLRLYRSIP